MRIIKAITLAAIFGFSAAQASACSCSAASNVDDQAASYELIFVGTPIQSVSLTPPPDQPKRSIWQRLQFWKPAPPVIALTPISGMHATEFRIKNVLKGPDSETVTIHHMSGDGASCGINFPDTSQEKLLLASLSKDGKYHTNGCAYPQFSVAEFQAALAAPATPIPSEDGSGTR